MNRIFPKTALLLIALSTTGHSFATDEPNQIRSQSRSMSEEGRAAHQSEMKERKQSMSEEERAEYRNSNSQGGSQHKYGSGYGSRQGQGQGSSGKGRK